MKHLKTLLLLSLPLQAATWTAHPGDDLQTTLDTLANGDTLLIGSGEYTGSLLIDRSVTLRGEGYPIINGEQRGNVIRITASNVHLQDLKIQWSGTRLLEDEAGVKIEGDDVIVRGCRITDTLHGIYVKGGKRVTIRDNFIRGRKDLTEALRGNGIHLWNTDHNLIRNNEVEYARDGIYFSFADKTDVVNNRIHNLRYGLHYMYSDDNSFRDNIFENNVAGAALMYSKRINFTGNIFAHNRGFRAYGILFQSCDYCRADNNLITDNTKGLHFDASNYNELRYNDVVENDIAVHINASCEENRLSGNNFISNLSDLVVDAKGYPNYWSEGGRGNYWSDYPGYDLDGDAIGDIPHRLQNTFEFLEGDYPEVRLYLFSPAAQLLAIAEQVFPILHSSDKKDQFPLMTARSHVEIPWYDQEEEAPAASPLFLLFFGILTVGPVVFIAKRIR